MNLDDLLPQHIADPASAQRDWSPLQSAIFDAQSQSPSNLQIEAVAGSGKTTTLVELMRRGRLKVLFLAFNKSIATELAARVSQNGEVRTLNSLGHKLMMRHRPGAQMNQWKSYQWLRQNMSGSLYESYGADIARAIGIAKGSAMGIISSATQDQFEEIFDHYSLEFPSDQIPSLAKLALRTFLALTQEQNEFDFDDQLWVPIAEGWTFPAYDTVYVDEAQDLNPIQHLMLRSLQARGARVIAVGDRRQAIYGFRGALTSSMDLLRDTFSMAELPLSITYRCALAITREAQAIVPIITARPNAPEGEVAYLVDFPPPQEFEIDSMIVCRNNAPIFELALQFLRARIPCRVMSNFLQEMDKFIKSFKAHEVPVLQARLQAWYDKQKEDCERSGKYGKLSGIEDRYETVMSFIREFTSVRAILGAILSLATSATGPRISTIHRAKGLEADTVYLLRYDLLPSPRATTQEQMIQEENLRYVAITRARNRLLILPSV